jgi:hypothetical protein
MPPAGFEDRDDHRTACASLVGKLVRKQILDHFRELAQGSLGT